MHKQHIQKHAISTVLLGSFNSFCAMRTIISDSYEDTQGDCWGTAHNIHDSES